MRPPLEADAVKAGIQAGKVATGPEHHAPLHGLVPEGLLPPEQQEEVAQDIEASMAKIFEGPAESAAPSGDMGDTRVFDQIQFGKDYEIE